MSRKSLFLLSLGGIAVFLAYRLSGWDFDWSLFISSLSNMQPGWITASIVVTFLTYLFRAFRWQILLKPLKGIRIGPLVSANVVGFSAIFILGRPGELIRPLWITRREQISLTTSVATIIVERVLDSLMLIVLFGLALLLVQLPPTTNGILTTMKNAAWLVVLGSAVAVALLFFFRSNIDRIVGYVPFARAASILRNFSEGLSFLQRGSSLALAVAYSIAVWITIVLQFWFMMLGMSIHFSIEAATLVLVGAAIGSVAQIPGIGGGFQAGYVFCMTTFFGVPPEQAIATSLAAWVLSNVPTTAVAALYMISHGLSLKDLRTAAVTE